MDKPDMGTAAENFDRERMAAEYTRHVQWATTPAAVCRPLITHPSDHWGTVTRGKPAAHLLSPTQLIHARLTHETWRLDVDADPYTEPPHVRVPAEIERSVVLDYSGLRALGDRYGTVTVLKSMQCLNVHTPLGQGVWEGVPLSTVLRECGQIDHCRRVYYWGWHNDDPKQVFRSSLSYTDVFEPAPGEPPAMLAFALNGNPIPPIRGGPVRMIVPTGHGFKSVKFLQHIRVTNDYRTNDSYAALAGSSPDGNDPDSVQKTYTSVDKAVGSPPVPLGTPLALSGVLTSGRTRASHLEYWVRGPRRDFAEFTPVDSRDPEAAAAPWVRFEIPPPPPFESVLPQSVPPASIFGVGKDGVPKQWPLPFCYTTWQVEVPLRAPGCYEVYARSVDAAGYAQPEPRPHHKNGRNEIEARRVTVV